MNTNKNTNILAFESIFLPLAIEQTHRLVEVDIVIDKKENVAEIDMNQKGQAIGLDR